MDLEHSELFNLFSQHQSYIIEHILQRRLRQHPLQPCLLQSYETRPYISLSVLVSVVIKLGNLDQSGSRAAIFNRNLNKTIDKNVEEF